MRDPEDMKRVILSLLGLPAALAAQGWVPYHSNYTITTTVHDAQGQLLQQINKNMYEVRGTDGSTATTEQVNGHTVATTIHLACGDFLKLNHATKTATVASLPHSPVQHFSPPKNDQPIGTVVIAGLYATGWPAHAQNGTGAMWFDTTNDILVKTEAHIKNPNGVSVDEIRVLVTIDLTSPVGPSATKLPTGFVMDANSRQPCDPTVVH